jgi:hypothetical protein
VGVLVVSIMYSEVSLNLTEVSLTLTEVLRAFSSDVRQIPG